MKKRSEADSKYTSIVEDMVAEDSQWEQMFKEASGEISEYASYKGDWPSPRIPCMPASCSTTSFPRR